MVMSHLGRPKGDPKKDAPFRMDNAARRLGELLGKPVQTVDAATGPSVTAAVQKLGLDNEGLGEVLAVIGLYNQMNKLADAYQVEPDILPEAR